MIGIFLDYLRYERNRSELTVQRYEKSLKDFETYFKKQNSDLSWKTVDTDVVRDWMEQLMDKGMKATSVCADLSALRTFFRFALSRRLIEKDPAYGVVGPKKQKPLPQFVRESDMDKLLDRDEWSDDYKDVRARTIILLLYETGLRRAELVGLDDESIDWSARQLKVTGKRNKQRIIPFGNELAEELKHYLELRNEKQPYRNTKALFVSEKGERLNGNHIYVLVRKYLSQVTTMKKRSPHVLRHSFATAMLNHGAGLESVKLLLGHESLETTEIYTHTTFEQLKRVYKDAHPRG
jgi:integrase/recombinase XerC